MPPEKIYNIIAVGIGPFNLGLAALCDELPDLNCLFIDQNESFNWHPGMMLDSARLQVPWYADLVSLASPCSKFIYMNYLHEQQKQFRFGIGDPNFIKRKTYNEYCRWVCDQLPSLQFGTTCTSIEKENNFYRVKTSKNGSAQSYLTQKIILGTGTIPFIPDIAKNPGQKSNDNIFHSSEYLFRKEALLEQPSVTVIGSGQSAAEIFYDLMQCYHGPLYWFTRSSGFYPMDYSKLNLEKSTPDYIDYFFALPERKKRQVLESQDALYKGINQSLISDIYDMVEELDSPNIKLYTSCELKKIAGDNLLTFLHTEKEKTFTHESSAVILATGYTASVPDCIKPLRPYIKLDSDGLYKANRNYSIDDSNSVFIQNGEQQTHGFNAPDLSLGPYRNAVILNAILGYDKFKIEKNVTFQTFGLP